MTGKLSLPPARIHDLVTTTAADEVLVYDTLTHHLHHLNPTTTAVWHACDGQRTLAEVQAAVAERLGTAVSLDTVRLALTQLADAALLAGPLDPVLRLAGQTRRRFLKRAAVAGAVAAPALVSITAPQAAASQSGPGPTVAPPTPPSNAACQQPCPGVGSDGNAVCASLGLGGGVCATCIQVGANEFVCL